MPVTHFESALVRDTTVAALTPVHAITVRSKLPAPALQRGEPYPQQTSDCSGSYTGGNRGLEDLQGFAPICGCGQAPSSSPQ